MAEEKIFADGFVFKRNENAPDFVVGRVSVKVDEAIAFLKQHESNGWVNLGVKTARSGNYYMDLDTFQANDSSKKEGVVDKYEAKTKKEEAETDLPF
jgi:hypothetical protein